MTVISLAEYRTARAIPMEDEGSVFRGLYVGFMLQGVVFSLGYLGWRIGELLLP